MLLVSAAMPDLAASPFHGSGLWVVDITEYHAQAFRYLLRDVEIASYATGAPRKCTDG